MLHDNKACGIMVTTDGWVQCPICKRNKRMLRVTPETVARNLPVFCRKCETEVILNIEGLSARRLSQ